EDSDAAFCRRVIHFLRLAGLALRVHGAPASPDGRARVFLRISPVINDGYLLNASDSTVGGARFLGGIFPLDVGESILLERDAGIAALLGAVMDEAVFANVQIAGTGAASPIVRFAAGEIFLEPIQPAVAVLAIGPDFAIDAFLAAVQWFHRARAVVNDAEGTGETEIHSASRNDLGVFRVANTAADHRIDVYSEISQFGKILQFLVQDFQAFFRNIE